MKSVYIISACRTAIGGFGGSLKDTSAVKLGEIVVREAINRAKTDANKIDEVIMGAVLQAGLGLNAARQIALNSGIPVEVPAYTVNKACGSGLKSVSLAAQSISFTDAECAVAGGVETMSRCPYLLTEQRWGARMGDNQVMDVLLHDGLHDPVTKYHVGVTAENIAEQYAISRQEQDEFAFQSQCKAADATRAGRFSEEIVKVNIPQRKGEPIVFSEDEHIKANTSLEKLAMLKPVFKKEGTVTAGNASGINDGAACVILASEEFVKEHEIKPLAKLSGGASVGVEPSVMGLGPIPSTKKALKLAGMNIDEIDLIELNEAFAAQSIAVIKDLELEYSKVNVNGGAIALGHPVGASGARILTTLIYELRRRNLEYGLATLCVGGGMGETMIVQRDKMCL